VYRDTHREARVNIVPSLSYETNTDVVDGGFFQFPLQKVPVFMDVIH
jgi:hypothetical protein